MKTKLLFYTGSTCYRKSENPMNKIVLKCGTVRGISLNLSSNCSASNIEIFQPRMTTNGAVNTTWKNFDQQTPSVGSSSSMTILETKFCLRYTDSLINLERVVKVFFHGFKVDFDESNFSLILHKRKS